MIGKRSRPGPTLVVLASVVEVPATAHRGTADRNRHLYREVTGSALAFDPAAADRGLGTWSRTATLPRRPSCGRAWATGWSSRATIRVSRTGTRRSSRSAAGAGRHRSSSSGPTTGTSGSSSLVRTLSSITAPRGAPPDRHLTVFARRLLSGRRDCR